MRMALIGDAQSPHLLKWARALSAFPEVELWVASSRGFMAEFDGLVPAERRLALGTRARHAGGNIGLLLKLPRLGAWLRRVDADWLHAHYLTSHGTLAWLARRFWRLRARIVGSAWGSDILVTPERSRVYRWLTSRVLQACTLCTSDSQHMAVRMRALGAGEVMTFPFGLEALPEPSVQKNAWLFYANRGLEPIYRPERVLEVFAKVVSAKPQARLVIANDGSLRASLKARARALGLSHAVRFAGRLPAHEQAQCYDRAQWYLSLPQSDSVAVSVLEAMAHGCIPLLSDLPANRELVRNGENGMIVDRDLALQPLERLLQQRDRIASANREWVERHALFAPAVARLLARMKDLVPA
jgi:glycosyltransferase involved in cell wall biosynthesis